MRRFKGNIVGLFAVLGGIAAGLAAPILLDELYHWVLRLTSTDYPGLYSNARNPLSIIAVSIIGVVAGGGLATLCSRLISRFNLNWSKMTKGDKVTLFLGLFAGIVSSIPFLLVFSALGSLYGPASMLVLITTFSVIAVYLMRSMDDVLPWQRAQGTTKRTGVKILDTNVIIDGRILDVAKTGFLEGRLYIPQFVLEELQYIADSPDALRRQRGKRGLDILRLLQSTYELEVGTKDRLAPEIANDEVDSRLVRLAKAMGADLLTNDVNLNRVATLQDVNVLNINDLAMALKPNILPKETLSVPIVREGNQPGQGVGYLDDGTMVVVEGGRRHINEVVETLVTQVIQTERGKMIFAEVPADDDPEAGPESNSRTRRR